MKEGKLVKLVEGVKKLVFPQYKLNDQGKPQFEEVNFFGENLVCAYYDIRNFLTRRRRY